MTNKYIYKEKNLCDLISCINNLNSKPTFNFSPNHTSILPLLKDKNNNDIINVKFTKDNYSLLRVLEREGLIYDLEVKINSLLNDKSFNNFHNKDHNFNLYYKILNFKIFNSSLLTSPSSFSFSWHITSISKPGRRIYISSSTSKYNITKKIRNRIYILRTSQGFLTDKEAFKENIGGELILKIKFKKFIKSN